MPTFIQALSASLLLIGSLLGAVVTAAEPAPAPTTQAADQPAPATTAEPATDPAPAAEEGTVVSPWPMEIAVDAGAITLYQPQLEKLDGITLTGRCAASLLPTGKGEEERIFGALWFEATLDIDRVNDVAKATGMKITRVVTPKGEKAADEGAAARAAIEKAVVDRGIEIDLDRLIATLEETASSTDPALAGDMPAIHVRQKPAVLVFIDGEPQTKDEGGVTRLINTPAFIAKDGVGTWWLRGKSDWLVAQDLNGPWTIPTDATPAGIKDAAAKAGFPTSVARLVGSIAPEVIVADKPTELIVFDGAPNLEPIGSDGKLLGATNTDTDVIVDVASGMHFVLLAGRWFSTKALSDEATWTLVRADQLPESFTTLPTEGDWSSLRVHVAGTPEADEAVALQQIPQTARIPRTATITLTFDGAPEWVRIGDLDLAYARNCGDAVFLLPTQEVYACRDGVWYTGKDPLAPLAIATSIPDVLHRIPPSCPWHNCSYVYVYDTSDDWICYGYTPGYLGWYTWYGCPIYGTGIWYPGWYHNHVHVNPLTWGVRIGYNPWTGWGVGIGISGGNWSIAIGGGGWWGSGGINNIDIDNINNINIGNGDRGDRNRPAQRPAVYDRVQGAERPNFEEAGNRLRQRSKDAAPVVRDRSAGQPLVDRDGTIHRPTQDGGWQTRQNGTWESRPRPENRPASRPETRPTTRPERPAERPTQRPIQRPQTIDHSQLQRSRGEARVQQRSSGSRSYGGGGARMSRGGGGGGRRR